MSTPFDEYEAIVSEAIDETYAGRLLVISRSGGKFVAGAETAGVEYLGIVDFNPVTLKPQDMGQYDGFQPNVAGERVDVSFDTGVIGPKSGWPKKGDHIKCLDVDGQPLLQVSHGEADGVGRVVFYCTPVSSS